MKELKKLMRMQTRLFVVHMTPFLGSRFFLLANKAGMMSEGYAWIITDSLSNLLSSMDTTITESMEGVLGIRPYVPKSEDLENFRTRWKRNMLLMKPNSTINEINIFALWAYDTIWALAMAIERIGPMNSSFLKADNIKNGSDIRNLGTSEVGPRLLREILRTRFKGLSGEFHLVNGQLQPSAFEIFNMVGKGDRVVGYWTAERGISRELSVVGTPTYSTSTKELKKIIWPGDTTMTPKGWAIPTIGLKLKIAVPVKKGFTEFVNVQINNHTNEINVTGFCIDVFLAALELLPFKVVPEFVSFPKKNGESTETYNDLLHKIPNKIVDAVVGDTTILADRASYVDFTLPYSESGLIMVVRAKHDLRKDMWIFTKPFRWNLWLTIAATSIFIGVAIRFLEHRVKPQQHFGMLFWFPLLVLAFPERRMVANKWSTFVLIMWLVMAFILMQSYTANLSSILTLEQIQPALPKHYNVGYQRGSFVKDFLVKRLNFDESKLKPYFTMEEYDEALSKGTYNGGVDAIFQEIPYVKLFLQKYCSKYMMVGTTYKTGGFGFAFPLGSRLVPYFSRAILNVIESGNMTKIETKNFGSGYSSEDQDVPIHPQNPSLSAYSFAGLFIITGFNTIIALFCSEGQRFVAMAKHFFNRIESRVHSSIEMNATGDPPVIDNQSDENVSTEDEVEMEGDNGDVDEVRSS